MRNRNYQVWLETALMLIVSAAIYLPFISQFGYYNDDWYSMYSARVAGPQVFHEIYGLDRPGRAYLMIPLYNIFQDTPLYYNISAYVLRVLGALCLLWLLRLIWRERKVETFLIAFLFLIYPGFLSMPNGIDFQSHLFALCFVFISIGMSILAYHARQLTTRLLFWGGSLLTGWVYLSQMEYYLGFETARLFLFALLIWRDNPGWKKSLPRTLYAWLPYSPVSVLYLVWRIFFFSSERVATDVGLKLGALAEAPLATLYDWLGHFIQSILNVSLLAWGVPLYQLAFPLETSSSIRGITLAVVVAVFSSVTLLFLNRGSTNDKNTIHKWQYEMFVIGVLWAIFGLFIVIFANRTVIFPAYSRYGMVSAAGAIMALVAGISFISEKRAQMLLVFFLFFSAAFTHYANGLQHGQVSQNMRAFWWQVSWRVPQFFQGTTLVVNYPNSGNREESFIWGPANQIYYPYRIDPEKIQAGIYAIYLDHNAVTRIQMQEGQVYRKRIIVETYSNYRNFIILSQPTLGSCLQVIDGRQPEFSRFEIDPILVVGQYSEIDKIRLSDEFLTPPQFLFGSEPPHGWCFYYEKAAYARQKGDWEKVLLIGEQALGLGLEPKDPIEWIPFLQAYAMTGNIERLTELAPVVTRDSYIPPQVCQIINSMSDIPVNVAEAVGSLYCPE